MLKWRKATAAALSVAMICTAMPVTAFAVEETGAAQEEQVLQQEETETISEEAAPSEETGAAEGDSSTIPADSENAENLSTTDSEEDDLIDSDTEGDDLSMPEETEQTEETDGFTDLAGEDSTEETAAVEKENAVEGDLNSEIRTGNKEVTFADSEVDLGDTDLLFEEYANGIFYPNTGMSAKARKSPRVTAGSNLTGNNLTVYILLRERAAAVAAGDESNTIIQIPFADLGVENRMYSAQELGLTTLFDDATGEPTDDAINAIYSGLGFSLSLVTDCLAADCPYELYWSSGSFGESASLRYSYNSVGINYSSSVLNIRMYVDPKYREYEDNATTADTDKTSAASNAALVARDIVDNASGMDDFGKLTYYKEEICNLVTYDYNAAGGGSQGDRGPWALIYVFDEDPNTNVVCEGYSEAFQYLGSLTEFDSGRVCVYSVTGTMDGGTGAGPHKWNIVRMNDGLNYIADITNSDDGSIGSDGKLFLTGMNGSPYEYYVKEWEEREETVDNGDGSFTIYTYPGGSIVYEYDNDTIGIFSEEELTLSANDYVYTDTGVTITSQPSDVIAKVGNSVEFTVEATGDDLHYQWQWSRDGEAFRDCQSAGHDTDTFSFTMKSTMDNRWYRCIVWNEDEEVFSEAATLTLNSLKITQQPESVNVNVGDPVIVSVAVSADEPVYQWQWSKDGITWKKCTGAGCNTNSFSFTMKESFANRQYRCMITDGSEKLYSQAAVIKLSGPEIVSQPQDAFAQNGETVTFAVEAAGDALKYQWQVSSTGTTWKNCSGAGYNTDTFSFTMKGSFSGRMYRCIVSSGERSIISDPATVTLVIAPAIIAQPQDVAAAPGETVAFNVEVVGTDPVYQWQVSSNGLTWKYCTGAGFDTAEFSFTMKSSYAGRKYRCIVDCEGERIISEYGELSLK